MERSVFTFVFTVVIAIALLLSISSSVHAQSGEIPTVAVLDLDMQAGIPEAYQNAFTDMLREELFHTGSFRVIERQKMENILIEQGFQLADCSSDECAVQVGRLLGVEQMVAGSISRLGELYTVSLRLIDVETGELLNMQSSRCQCPIEEVATTSLADAARAIAGGTVASERTSSRGTSGRGGSDSLPGMTFVQIPGGEFMMGSPPSEQSRDDEGPQHRVTIQPFEMMTTEVTQAQWEAVMGNNPSNFKSDVRPVEQVSWNDVQEFIRKLNELDPGNGYRLPSEAEWEYACRAGTMTRFYSGDNDSDIGSAGWFIDNSSSITHPVGEKNANGWGLYDMNGNVWELCEDLYHISYDGAPADGSAWVSPSGLERVVRSGGWHNSAWLCRSANRGKRSPIYRDSDLGFRLVNEIK